MSLEKTRKENMRKYRKMEEDLNEEFNSLKENLNEVQKQSENFIVIKEKR